MKMPVVTPQDVAVHVSRRNRRRVGKKLPPEEEMLLSFSAEKLFSALKDKGKRIDMSWYVRKLLSLLSDEYAKVSDKVVILDKIRDLLVLGSVQDKGLIEEMTGKVESPKEMSGDPFSGVRKVKLVGG